MITKYNLFLERKNNKDQLNEGLFGKLFNWLGKISKQIKGSVEIDKIFDKYKTNINQLFDKWIDASKQFKASKTNVQQGLENEKQIETPTVAKPVTEAKEIIQTQQVQGSDTQKMDADSIEKLNKLYTDKINDVTKQAVAQIEEVGKSLNKKNPSRSLEKYITTKKYEFQDIVFRKKEEYYKETGNKETLLKVQKARAEIEKKLQASSKELQNILKEEGGDQKTEYKTGQKLKYTKKDGTENIAQVVQDQEDVQKNSIKLKTDKNKGGFAIKKDKIVQVVQDIQKTQN